MADAVDVVAVESLRAVALRDDRGVADEQVVEALLGVGHDHVTRFQQVLFAVLAGVILDALVLVAAALVNCASGGQCGRRADLRLCS